MKTTIEISDALLQAAKRMAAERNVTLRTIVEAALRRHLEALAAEAHGRRRLRRHSFRGRGLQPGLSESDWAAVRERAYEGRGG
jgi:Arc/MetJ family transcription regulator